MAPEPPYVGRFQCPPAGELALDREVGCNRIRCLQVIVNSVSVTESAYDQLLNPIQAKVDLEMRSMTDIELQNAGVLFEALGYINLVARDVMAHLQIGGAVAQAAVQAAKNIKGMLPF